MGFGGYNTYGMIGMMSGAYGFSSVMILSWLISVLIIIVLILFIAWIIKQLNINGRKR